MEAQQRTDRNSLRLAEEITGKFIAAGTKQSKKTRARPLFLCHFLYFTTTGINHIVNRDKGMGGYLRLVTQIILSSILKISLVLNYRVNQFLTVLQNL